MLKRYVLAVRHLWKNKLFSLINILGLSLGIASCTIILFHVKHELSFDQFQPKKDRIVRILHEQYAYTPYVMGKVLPGYFPEIDKVLRIVKLNWSRFYIVRKDIMAEETDCLFADSTLFDVFSFPLVLGDTKSVLSLPYHILISQSVARKYFGNENPMGKVISLRLVNTNYDFTIGGVFRDFPEQSHFHARFIGSMDFYMNTLTGGMMANHWGANSVFTYLLLKEHTDVASIEARMPAFIHDNVPKEFAKDLHYTLQPLSRIHLYTKNGEMDIEPQGSITRVWIFSSIAIAVLVVAIVNFALLTFALSYRRIREFGIRKVVGARRSDLIKLINAEFLIIFILSLQIAIMIVELGVPFLSEHLGLEMQQGLFKNTWVLAELLGIVILLGYLSSVYITVNISGIHPIEALRNRVPVRFSRLPSRSILVVFQFTLMITLISCILIMQKQLIMLRKSDLGFRKEQLITLNIPGNSFDRYKLLKEELRNIQGVANVSGAAYLPPTNQWWISGLKNPQTGENIDFEEINGDYDLAETLGLTITQGRSFSRTYGMDSLSIMINETGLKMLGMKNPLDNYLIREESDPLRTKKKIIGVFKDFHIRPLYDKIQPMAIFLSPEMVQQMAVRLTKEAGENTLNAIKSKWKEVYPDDPIQYTFVNEGLQRAYSKEDKAYALIMFFAVLSMVIALLGLFGLSAIEAQGRRKETGIRKVNGAMPGHIFYSLSYRFIIWIITAFCISTPLSWYIMHRWLEHFAYRTSLSWWIFGVAAIVSFVAAMITVGWQTILAATRNPVEALRYE